MHGVVQKISGGPVAYKDMHQVEILLMGEQMVIGENVFSVELEKKFVDIRVKGPEPEIVQITPLDIVAYVNVAGLKSGKTYSPVVSFILPPRIKVIGAPELVRVSINDKTL